MKRSKRYEALEKKPINEDTFFAQEDEYGLTAMHSKYDPTPEILIKEDKIVRMDGKSVEEFDSIEYFIANYGIDIANAPYAMALEDREIARMIVDIHVPREEVIKVTTAITPAKMLQVVNKLNSVEIMMGQMKMRARKTPANQAHVTNLTDNPALLAADAAEAAMRGFSEIETTCAVSRFAPINAIAILIGSQAGRAGVLTQCAMEESLELKMGLRGLTSYAETVSLYGTEESMDDGDDTPWSKAFLASAYASRGIKMRTTSGTGSEVLMGHSHKKSMLYLEILCVYLARACGSQGVQNGSISCIGITTAVPEGFRAIAAENLVVSLLNMELASGNDQTFTHSDMRRTTKLLMQMMPGTDFITSGYSATPNFDDVFAGSNTDCDDYDDYYMIQRDMQIDGGIVPISEAEAIRVRMRAAKACQAVFTELDLPEITEEEILAAVYAYSHEEMPQRNLPEDLNSAGKIMNNNICAIDLILALNKRSFCEIANRIFALMQQRVSGDYLQTSSIFDENFKIISALNDRNNYTGPGTGYRLEGDRWEKLKVKSNAIKPADILKKKEKREDIFQRNNEMVNRQGSLNLSEMQDIVIAVSPAFGTDDSANKIQRQHTNMVKKIMEGVTSSGLCCNLIRVNNTTDLNKIAMVASQYSKTGIGIGVESKGGVCIQKKDMENDGGLEYYFNLPLSATQEYKKIGQNAVSYARNLSPQKIIRKKGKNAITNYQVKMICLSTVDSEKYQAGKAPNHVDLLSKTY